MCIFCRIEVIRNNPAEEIFHKNHWVYIDLNSNCHHYVLKNQLVYMYMIFRLLLLSFYSILDRRRAHMENGDEEEKGHAGKSQPTPLLNYRFKIHVHAVFI